MVGTIKRLPTVIMLLLFFTQTAWAGTIVAHTSGPSSVMKTEILTLTADASDVDLHSDLLGGYLYSVEIYASADDALTFTVNSGLGTELYTTTTTGATSGEIGIPTAYYPITRMPTYTVSGIGSGTVTVEVTVVKR